jgi:hypothetical protein
MPRDNDTTASTSEGGQTSLANRSHEVADEVRQATLERVESARASAQSAKDNAAERVRKFGATVRKVGEHLRVEDQRFIADKANDASQRLDNFASYLSSAELGTMLRDTGSLARGNPGWFFGGAFVVGLAAGRFLKGSAGAGAYSNDEPTTGVTRRPREAGSYPKADAEQSQRSSTRSYDRPASQTAAGQRTDAPRTGANR